MPMDSNQLKTFLPDIRSRMMQAQTTHNLQKQLSMPAGSPVQTSVHSFSGITFLPRINQRIQSQVGEPFPIRPEVSSRLSMTNQLNIDMREADRKVKENDIRARLLKEECIPTKARLLQRGMLQGRAFRLPALGTTHATLDDARSQSTELPKISPLPLSGKYAEANKSAEPSEHDECEGSVDTRNTSSSLSIEPYPFSEDESDFETDREDLTDREVKPVKLPNAKKLKKRKKVSPPKPKPLTPEPLVIKRRKPKRRWQDVKPVKDLTPTAYEKELEKLLPERKSFFYSRALERELRRHIPPRLPGGKLKPVYKRSKDGEIYLPKHPLDIRSHQLVDGSAPKAKCEKDAKGLTRRPGEDLPSFNARMRRWEEQEEMRLNTSVVSFKEYSHDAKSQDERNTVSTTKGRFNEDNHDFR